MNKNVLFVDDEPNVLAGYKRSLRNDFNVITAESGKKAFEIMAASPPFAVIVSDFKMPEMNGVDFLYAARLNSPDSIRVMLTGFADIQTTMDAVNEGNIFRILTKPCPLPRLLKMLTDSVRQHELIMSEKELLNKTLKGSIKVLVEILSIANPLAFSQASQILKIATKLSANLDPDIKWQIEIAALLSQIGCVALPTEILEKRNSGQNLNPKEKELYLSHPQIGKSLIKNIPRLEDVAEAIACQFTRFLPTGEAMKTENDSRVSIIARILKHATDLNSSFDEKISGIPSEELFQQLVNSHTVNSSESGVKMQAEQIVELRNYRDNCELRSLLLENLEPGMVVGQNIIDKNGVSLVSEGHELSVALIKRLGNIAESSGILEPLKIYVPKGENK